MARKKRQGKAANAASPTLGATLVERLGTIVDMQVQNAARLSEVEGALTNVIHEVFPPSRRGPEKATGMTTVGPATPRASPLTDRLVYIFEQLREDRRRVDNLLSRLGIMDEPMQASAINDPPTTRNLTELVGFIASEEDILRARLERLDTAF